MKIILLNPFIIILMSIECVFTKNTCFCHMSRYQKIGLEWGKMISQLSGKSFKYINCEIKNPEVYCFEEDWTYEDPLFDIMYRIVYYIREAKWSLCKVEIGVSVKEIFSTNNCLDCVVFFLNQKNFDKTSSKQFGPEESFEVPLQNIPDPIVSQTQVDGPIEVLQSQPEEGKQSQNESCEVYSQIEDSLDNSRKRKFGKKYVKKTTKEVDFHSLKPSKTELRNRKICKNFDVMARQSENKIWDD